MPVKAFSRRTFLRGVGACGAMIRIGLPPLEAMTPVKKVEPRFVFWFNGNGIPEKYWIPAETGSDYELTACLKPLRRFATTFMSSPVWTALRRDYLAPATAITHR